MLRRLILALFACLGPAALVQAQSPELKLPAFTQLRSHATESVDISLGSLPLRFIGWMAGHEGGDPDAAEASAMLKGLHALHVQHYEFAADFAYPQADVEAVRSQLASQGWSQLIQMHDQKKSENVDIYVSMDKERITGLAIVASEPREFTIVNAVGSLDLAQVDKLRRHFEYHHDSAASPPPWPVLL